MKTITVRVPNETHDHLEGLAMYQNISLPTLYTEILKAGEKELWKAYGQDTQEMLEGLEYYNAHIRS